MINLVIATMWALIAFRYITKYDVHIEIFDAIYLIILIILIEDAIKKFIKGIL